jgi:N-acetylneuraminate synthase
MQTKLLVEAVDKIHIALNNPIDKNNNESFKELKSIFEKSLAINKDLPKGHTITFDDLESKKPSGFGISAKEFKNVIGKKLANNKTKWDFLNEEDLE